MFGNEAHLRCMKNEAALGYEALLRNMKNEKRTLLLHTNVVSASRRHRRRFIEAAWLLLHIREANASFLLAILPKVCYNDVRFFVFLGGIIYGI